MITDKQVERYQALKDSIKVQTKELEDLRKIFIASKGTETDTYVVELQNVYKEIVASKEAFSERMGTNFLRENGLLNYISYPTVKIIRKL